jgi:hypothetical protein
MSEEDIKTEDALESESDSESQPESASEPESQPESKPKKKDEIISSEIVGKKIFFVYPSVNIQNNIMTELAQQELEVYVVKDHNHLTRSFKRYPDSIIYINFDDGAPKNDLERWIETLHTSAPDVKIGVFSSSSEEEFRKKYTDNPHIGCGLINLRLDMHKAVPKIIETLEGMNVKGRRKYLRASTDRENTATINIPHGGNYINGSIRDVSVVGISCMFESDPFLKKNTFFKDIQIRLQSMLIKAEAVVFGSRTEFGNTIYVLLFTQKVDTEVRAKIRKYIQQNLQHKMDYELK